MSRAVGIATLAGFVASGCGTAAGPSHALHARVGSPRPQTQEVRAAEAPVIVVAGPPCTLPSQQGASAALSAETFVVPAAQPGLTCCAYLRHAPGVTSTRLAYFQSGSGIYTTAHGDLDGLGRSAARSRRTAILSIDKPGVGATRAGRPTLDRDAFSRHTLADLVSCAKNAVEASLKRANMSPTAKVLAHGHSEGAQVWSRVIDEESSTPSTNSWMPRLEASFLSGLPLEPVSSGAERQLDLFLPMEIDAFRRALATRDDDYLLLLGMPWRYLEHSTARESVADALDRVAIKRPGLRIDLFHGERDRNAPYALVRQWVERNARARAEQRPALDLRLHAYPGAFHQLDERLDTDLDALVDALGEE